jgi:glucokinase
MTKVSVGIDIGGTNIAYGLVDNQANVLFQNSIPTKDFPTAEDFAKNMAAKINEAIKSVGNVELVGIGIGAPNGNYYNGTIEYAPNLKWKGVIKLKDLFSQFFNVPVIVTNDANAATIGEMIYGGAKGLKDFILITLGTGLGSGIVANGELIYGFDGFAGEIGHTFVYLNSDRECGCGRKGCLETYASATGICRTVFELMGRTMLPSELRNIPYNQLTAAMISDAAKKGDKLALEAFDVTGKLLGIKLADSVAHTTPEAIFLFGGLANAGDLIFKPTQKYFEENLLTIYKNKIKILPSSLNEKNGAILGSAALIWKANKN